MSKILDLMFAITGDRATGAATAAVTPPQFDNDKSAATTEFVQRALGNLKGSVQHTVSGNIAAASAGGYVSLNGGSPLAMVLPAPASVPVGAAFHVSTDSTTSATITASGGTTFGGTLGNGATSFVMQPGLTCEFVNLGTSYIILNGTGSALLSVAGKMSFPGGLIMQWGVTGTMATETSEVVTFPAPFPNAVVLRLASVSDQAGDATDCFVGTRAINNSSMRVVNPSAVSTIAHWFAIGY